MTDIDMVLESLLTLAQLALAIVGIDAITTAFLDFTFLTGVIRQIAYAGGAVGVLDQLAWLATERVPKLLDMY